MKQTQIVSGVEVLPVCWVYDSNLLEAATELMYGEELSKILPAVPPFQFDSIISRLQTTTNGEIREYFNHSNSWMLALDQRDQGVKIVQFWADRPGRK